MQEVFTSIQQLARKTKSFMTRTAEFVITCIRILQTREMQGLCS